MKTLPQNISFFVIAGLLILLSACSEKPAPSEAVQAQKSPPDTSRIQPLVEGVNIPYQTFEVDGDQAQNLKLSSGTQIHIPARAFTTSDGQVYNGSVQLRYREFHHAADILAAGIPMNYQAEGYGERKPFITAGSFEIRAQTPEGDSLQINAEKPLEVRFGSRIKSDDYQSYYYNEEAQEWDYIGQQTAQPNPKRQELEQRINKAQWRQGWFILSLARAFDYHCDTCGHYDAIENRSVFEPVMEKYHVRYTQQRSDGEIDYKGNSYTLAEMVWKRISGASWEEFSQYGYHGTWNPKSTNTRAEALGNGNYRLRIRRQYIDTTDDGKNTDDKLVASMIARPVMPIRMLLSKSPEAWNENYQKTLAEARKAEKQLQQQAETLRRFKVRQTGYFNCDRFMKRENAKPVALNIQLPNTATDSSLSRWTGTKAFALVENERGVLNLNKAHLKGIDSLYLPQDAKLKLAFMTSKGLYVSKRLPVKYPKVNIPLQFKGPVEQVSDIHQALDLPYRRVASAE